MKQRKNKWEFLEKKGNVLGEKVLQTELKNLDKKKTYSYGHHIVLDILDDEHVSCQKYQDLNLITKSSNNIYSTSIEVISFLNGLEDSIQKYSSDYFISFISQDELIYCLPFKCKYLYDVLDALNDIEENKQKVASEYRNKYWEKYEMDSLSRKRSKEIGWLMLVKL